MALTAAAQPYVDGWVAAQPARVAVSVPHSAASRQPPAIHPAVARIVAPGRGSVSYGSGTLVYADDQRGVVITNWHVVNEAAAPISVHFPDGFYSLGTVQAADRDWDLAAIVIRKPNVQPVPLAAAAPRPGEVLTIAGYGPGTYRAASGLCTQYVAPGTTFPYEMVEVAVSARQGDSGGPIFNGRGELAGVLFGEGGGRTSGSYCGRVRWFLSSVVPIGTPSTLPGGQTGVALAGGDRPPAQCPIVCRTRWQLARGRGKHGRSRRPARSVPAAARSNLGRRGRRADLRQHRQAVWQRSLQGRNRSAGGGRSDRGQHASLRDTAGRTDPHLARHCRRYPVSTGQDHPGRRRRVGDCLARFALSQPRTPGGKIGRRPLAAKARAAHFFALKTCELEPSSCEFFQFARS